MSLLVSKGRATEWNIRGNLSSGKALGQLLMEEEQTEKAERLTLLTNPATQEVFERISMFQLQRLLSLILIIEGLAIQIK